MDEATDAPGTPPGAPPPDVTIDVPPDPATARLASTQASEVRAHRVDASQSAIGRAVARELRSDQGALGFVRADTVVADAGAVGAIAAQRVEMHDGFAFLVLARRMSGDVTVLLDWRSAIAAAGVLLVLGRLLRGRR